MGDMMKMMGKRGGMMQRMMGMGGGGGAAPSAAELEKMQVDLAKLDPKALESLPKELRDQLPKGLPKGMPGLGGSGPVPRLPGLAGGAPRFTGLPGLPGKKK
jgi:signal recognition particle subunit SRP54